MNSRQIFYFLPLISFYLCFVLLSACSHGPSVSSKTETEKTKNIFEGFPGSYNGDEWKTSNEKLELQLDVYKKTLPNGLTVLFVENQHLPIFSLYTFYKVGSRYEKKGITGASHFLEHLMFKGAKKYGPGEFDSIIEKGGGASNAYTTSDLTVYHENLPSFSLEKILDLESDRMQNLLLDKAAFESERQVILEERRLRYENSPQGQLYQAMLTNMFDQTPYGVPTIGSIEDISKVSRDEIQNYFKKFYAPNNAVLVLVGGVNRKESLNLIDQYFSDIPSSTAIDEAREKDSESLYQWKAKWGNKINLKGTSVNPLFAFAFKGEKLGTHKAFVMDLLSSILGDGVSSYLSQQFVTGKHPLASGISVSNYNLKHMGIFFIMGELLGGVNLSGFENNLKQKLKDSCDEAINSRTVQKTKNQYLVGYFRSLQTNAGVASFIGVRETFFDDYEIYKKELEIYTSITTQEIKDVCHELINSNENMFLSVWNKN